MPQRSSRRGSQATPSNRPHLRPDGGTLITEGDTVQPGGFMQAARWSLGAQRFDSRSGGFRVTGPDETATIVTSRAFASDIDDPIAPDKVPTQLACGKEKRVGEERRPAREEAANRRCVGPVLRMAQRLGQRIGPRPHGGAGRIGMLTLRANCHRGPGNSPAARRGGQRARFSYRTKKSRRCGSPDEPWRPRWRRRVFP